MKKYIKIISILCVLVILFTSCDILQGTQLDSEAETGAESTNCSAHADYDDNGSCDICFTSLYVTIDFYVINDLHGKFDDTSSNEGVDELTTYLKQMSDNDDHSVLLSSGDMWQGSSESNLTKGLLVTDWMNHLGFVSMTLGNHEFDWGEEYIEANDELADFPFLAINIFDRDTNERVEYCEASTVISRGGIEIGIIGAVGDCYSSISADKTEDIYFKTGAQLTALVKAEADRLREQGVDYIVYSIHDGYERNKYNEYNVSANELRQYYDIQLSQYVDLVFEGHTHKNYVMVDRNGVYHMQNGGENKGISHVEIMINSVTNTSSVTEAEIVSTSTYTKYDDDAIVDELLEKYKDSISIGNEVLGTNDRTRSDSEVEYLVARLYLEAGLEKWSDEYDIVLGGGFIRTRSPYDLKSGTIKYSDIQSLLPFDNQIVLCSINGSDLLRRFIETNNSDYSVYYSEYGNSVKSNIDPNQTYYVICDSYTSSYSYNNLTVVAELFPDVFARDLVAEYIKNGGLTSSK